MPTAVVTGAGSGIGHAFARILIEQGWEVHAADLTMTPAFQELRCRLHVLDVRNQDSIYAFSEALQSKPLDLLLNVAGVMSPKDEDQLETISLDVLQKTFAVNTFGPLLLTQALLASLQLSEMPRVGIVSSRVGSIGDNSTGGSYAYRASKAAVNSIGKSMSVDLKERGVTVSLLHPGYVRTNLSGPGVEPHPESVEPEEAAEKLWMVMQAVGIDQSGKFWHREGHELQW